MSRPYVRKEKDEEPEYVRVIRELGEERTALRAERDRLREAGGKVLCWLKKDVSVDENGFDQDDMIAVLSTALGEGGE